MIRRVPPPFVEQAITAIRALLAGERRDLSTLPIDMSDVPDFNRKVYDVALAIPHGETLTYGEVAARIGEPGAARAVGVVLGQNPIPIIVPCHRVIGSSGSLTGYGGGLATKQLLLTLEGVELDGDKLRRPLAAVR